ncbi:glycosyltransferase family 4 protein, partial [Candidatus Vampirococcus lugosii]
MKNILVLNYEFPPLGGGQANANYYLFKEFSKFSDYEFTLITSSTDKEYYQNFSNNIKIYYLDINKNGKNFHNQGIKNLLKNAYKTYKLAKKLIKKNNFNYIMCWSYPAIGIGYKLNKKYNIPYITLLRGSDVPFYEQKWKNLDKYIFQYLAPKFWKNSKYVIANSEQLKNLALKISPKQDIQIITNGINLEEFKNTGNKKDNKNFNILFVGRLTERKGILELTKAFKNFAKDKEDIKLNIVGDGGLYEEIKEYIEKNNLNNKIILHGLINHNKIKQIYHQNDIYILPSSNEGMSNTLLEALASSLPVIITDVGGTKELFD